MPGPWQPIFECPDCGGDLADGGHVPGCEKYEPKPDKTMTVDEYLAANLKGWHAVCWDVDGFGNVGIRYGGK